LNLPADRREFSEFAETVAPGVARVRPAVFQSLTARAEAAPVSTPAEEGLASRRTTARRAYAPPGRNVSAPPPVPARMPVSVPVRGESTRPLSALDPSWEKQLAPLRSLSRELVGHGMPAALVTELLAEIVAEYGNQVLESEQDARWGIVDQLLLRISGDPLVPPAGELTGTYMVAGPEGSGRSALIGTLALAALKRGQQEVILVNTEAERIGAAAQMEALGNVFACRVEHSYSVDDLRDVQEGAGAGALLLAQGSGWSAADSSEMQASAWSWPLRGATRVLCLPATGQGEDLSELLSAAHEVARSPMAVLSRTSSTRNVLPAIGALAAARQPVGLVLRDQNLSQPGSAPSLAMVVRTALGIRNLQKKRGRVVC
jgi:hypothetical protein